MMDDDEPPMASAADYEELRSVDAWLNLLVDLEELEHEHLINLAVSYVPSYTYPPPACRRSLWFAKLENQRGVVSERTGAGKETGSKSQSILDMNSTLQWDSDSGG